MGVLGILSAISAGLGIIGQLCVIAEGVSKGKAPGKQKRASVIDSFFGFVEAGVSGGWLRGDWKTLAEQKTEAKEIVGALVDAAVKVANDVSWKEEQKEDPLKKITP